MIPTTDKAYQLMHEGVIALAQVEANGMRIDTDYIKQAIDKTTEKIKSNESKLKSHKIGKTWKKRYGDKFKFGSREQLGIILFDVLKYKSPGQTKGTKPRHKTDDESLKTTGLKFVELYQKNEQLKKARSTYLRGILREVDNGYLHPFFNLNTTQTYRSSSDSPNFQNIPIRDPEFAELIRTAFISRKNYQIIEIDYGGAEICCATCYHKDPVMISYIKDKTKDLHRDMAGQIYNLKTKEISKTTRYCGKNMFVFPQFYGDYYLSCCQSLWEAIDKLNLVNPITGYDLYSHLETMGIHRLGKCSPKQKPVSGTFEYHVQQVEKDFWQRRFKIYDQWKKDWWEEYQKHMKLITLTGFIIEGPIDRKKSINYPVQGSAFHWLLWSLIRIQKILNKYKMKSLIVGQIHDSIVGDVYYRERQNYLEICQQVMTIDIRKYWKWINVPLTIEAEVAPINGNWYQKIECKL